MGQEYKECPECKTVNSADATFCTGCGYDFKTRKKGVGPFSFAFPAVEHVYTATGKMSWYSIPLMLLFGLLVAMISPIVAYVILLVFPTNPGQYWLLSLFLAFVMGGIIGLAVSFGGRLGKNRNSISAAIVGGISGIVCFVMAWNFIEFGEITIVIAFCGIVLLSVLIPLSETESNPFCETCNQFMKVTKLPKISISTEQMLMDILEHRQFEKLFGLASRFGSDAYIDNYCEVTIWHCESCMRGIISMETTQTRNIYDNKGNLSSTKSESRLVYSSFLEKSETERTP